MKKEKHKFGTLLIVLFLSIASLNVVHAETTISSIVANPDAFNSNTGSTNIDYTVTDVTNGNVFLKIYDSANNPIRTIDGGIQSGLSGSIVWDGKDNDGLVVLDGDYTSRLNISVGSGNSYEFVLNLPGSFEHPLGVAVDSIGNVYIPECISGRIHKFDSNYAFITMWGSAGDGDGQYHCASGIAVDSSGNVYVRDYGYGSIKKFSSAGEFITKWSLNCEGQDCDGNSIAVDSNGNVYVADTRNHRIQKFSSTGEFITKWGSVGDGDGQFVYPMGVAVDPSGNVYVADTYGDRIQKFSSTGEFITKWWAYFPTGVAVDPSGNVYVGIGWGYRIQKFSSTGEFITECCNGANGGFFLWAMAVDSSGNIYVADTNNDRIQKFAPSISTISAQTHVIVDNTLPITDCGSADGLWHGSDVSIACTASDSGSGLASPIDTSVSLSTNVADGEETSSASTNSHNVCDKAGNCATAGPISGIKVDKKNPSISIIAPITGTFMLNQAIPASYSCADMGSGLDTCNAPVPSGNNIDTSTVGSKSFTVNAKDNAGNTALATNNYNVIYNFNGFFRPIDNLDSNNKLILNAVKAVSAIPAKFSLSGNQGLGIITPGFPKSSPISCDSNAVVDPVDETVIAGSSSLSYDATLDQYIYVWKTDKTWSNTCRQLNVKLIDGTIHVANFKFTK